MTDEPTALRIRAREPRDLEDITAILNCPGVTAWTLQLPLRSVESRRERFTVERPDQHCLVAEQAGRVIGELSLQVEPQARRRHVGSIGMCVHDDHQGRGVGTALLRAAIDLADNWLNLQRLELSVYVDNAAGVRLYQKLGFLLEGTSMKYAYRNGAYVDAYHMARLRP